MKQYRAREHDKTMYVANKKKRKICAIFDSDKR